MCTESKLTVYFDDPFWVGVYERRERKKMQVARIVFGAEPKDYEVYGFLLYNWSLLKFSPLVQVERTAETKINPKRMQREAQRQLCARGISTKAQTALSLQREMSAVLRKADNHARTEEEKQQRFDLRQQKKKEKHRGR